MEPTQPAPPVIPTQAAPSPPLAVVGQNPPNTQPAPPPAPKKRRSKTPLLATGAFLLIFVAVAVGFFGRGLFSKPEHMADAASAKVNLPKDAIVTAECTEGRGKQYIETKNIPDGPIYDVVDGQVVAIEYLVGLGDLVAKPDNFKDLNLDKGQFDHMAVISTNPHAGMTEQHFHVVGYLISAEAAKSITCNGNAASSTTDMTHTTHN